MLETLPAPSPDPIHAEIVPRSENQIILPALIQNAGDKTARAGTWNFFWSALLHIYVTTR
jgi:hypothetical protein